MFDKYTIGIDFGTQSGRAVLVRVRDGKEVAVSVMPYPHGVITGVLPTGEPIPPDFALQHPKDYLRVLEYIIQGVMEEAKVRPQQVIALGIATTASTILPVLSDGTPLCFLDDYVHDPHSWIKLWKHHGAYKEAAELDDFLRKTAPELALQFGTGSAERMFPKILEIQRQSPEIYNRAYTFVEVADWMIWQLTGKLQRSAPIAGYKSMWRKETGVLEPKLLEKMDDSFTHIIQEKLAGDVIPLGYAGAILPDVARRMGLHPGTIAATGYIDAHSAVPGCGVTEAGRLVMVMGTSSCHMLLSEKFELVEGMSGVVQDGIIDGLYGYESGQSSVGDIFQWFVTNALPEEYKKTAEAHGVTAYEYLETLAQKLTLGRTGLLALDWWNGNRSILNDSTLSGMIVGLSTLTRPEEIYLALIESTAFGARRIIESYEAQGLDVNSICVCGGLPRKCNLLVQVYANVTNRTIEVVHSDLTSALGMSMWAAVAAGPTRGGYGSIREAVFHMAPRNTTSCHPNREISSVYDVLYNEYEILHDYFGRGENNVMKRLHAIRQL